MLTVGRGRGQSHLRDGLKILRLVWACWGSWRRSAAWEEGMAAYGFGVIVQTQSSFSALQVHLFIPSSSLIS